MFFLSVVVSAFLSGLSILPLAVDVNAQTEYAATTVLERNGYVLWEAEDAVPDACCGGVWALNNDITDYRGAGYYRSGFETFIPSGRGLLTYPFYTDQGGQYQFQFRTTVDKGIWTTEHNDSFVRMRFANGTIVPPASEHILVEGGQRWIKAYITNTFGFWTWQASSEGNAIFWDLAPGELYFLELSNRSDGHCVDRVLLWNRDNALTEWGKESDGKVYMDVDMHELDRLPLSYAPDITRREL